MRECELLGDQAPHRRPPPGSTDYDDRTQDELSSQINADLTPFPSGCYPRGAP